MPIKLKNNVSGFLATAISASDTGLVLQSGNGAAFPTLGASDYFYATLVSTGGTQEVVKVTARVGDTMTVVRAQEGSSAAGFAAGTRMELRVTVGNIEGGIYTPAGTSAVPSTIQTKLREVVSVKDFGAVGDGITDDTTAIQAWISYLGSVTYKPVGYIPPGVYVHTQPIVWANLRNITVKGAGGNAVQRASQFRYKGTALDALGGCIKITSCFSVYFEGISFFCETTGLDYAFTVTAEAAPALSSVLIDFKNCGFFLTIGSVVNEAGILVTNTKMIRFTNCFVDARSARAFRFGLDQSESPSTLMLGSNQAVSVENCFVYGDIDFRQNFGASIKINSFPERQFFSGLGATSITVSGGERVTGVLIEGNFFEQLLGDVPGTTGPASGVDLRPAITTSSFVGNSALAAGTGWTIRGNIFRDRAAGIQIAHGGVYVGANTFMQRDVGLGPAVQKGIIINSTVPANAAIAIDSTNDFIMADLNNFVAIEDNRTYIGDSVISSQALAADTTLTAIGTYEIILSAASIRAIRGGKYRITYSVSGLASADAAGTFRARVTIGGVDYGTVTRQSVGNSESFTLSLSRIVVIPPTTAVVTVVLLVEQASGTTPSLLRAGNSANGATFLSVEELP
jgi:hypothetical protein